MLLYAIHGKINTKDQMWNKFLILNYCLLANQETGPELEQQSGWPRGFGLLN